MCPGHISWEVWLVNGYFKLKVNLACPCFPVLDILTELIIPGNPLAGPVHHLKKKINLK